MKMRVFSYIRNKFIASAKQTINFIATSFHLSRKNHYIIHAQTDIISQLFANVGNCTYFLPSHDILI